MEKFHSKKEPWLLLHMVHRLSDIKDRRSDIVPPEQFIQLASLNLPKGTTFQPHKHVIKAGPNVCRAQETWIVISGKVMCIFYDIDDTVLATRILEPGDCSITLLGGHNYEILEEGTIVYEVKTGPYQGQQKDKEFI